MQYLTRDSRSRSILADSVEKDEPSLMVSNCARMNGPTYLRTK